MQKYLVMPDHIASGGLEFLPALREMRCFFDTKVMMTRIHRFLPFLRSLGSTVDAKLSSKTHLQNNFFVFLAIFC